MVFEQKGADSKSYTYGDDLLSQTANNQTSYYTYDGLGSIKALTDVSGAVTDTYSYNAYGELASKTGTTANDYLYTGEQYDQDLSQYYLRARYYNQANSRFTQMDSWQGKDCTPITLNKYAYAGAAPTMYVDPSGNMFSLGGLMAGLEGQANLRNSQAANGIRSAAQFLQKVCEAAGNVTAKGHLHHLFPYYIRGLPSKGKSFNPANEALVELVAPVHQRFHSLLDLVMRSKGFAAKSGKGNGYKAYQQYRGDLYTTAQLMDSLLTAAEIFDDVCGSISKPPYSMKDNMKNSWGKDW